MLETKALMIITTLLIGDSGVSMKQIEKTVWSRVCAQAKTALTHERMILSGTSTQFWRTVDCIPLE